MTRINKTQKQNHELNVKHKIVKNCENEILKLENSIKGGNTKFKNELMTYGKLPEKFNLNNTSIKEYRDNVVKNLPLTKILYQFKRLQNKNHSTENYIWHLKTKIDNINKH